MKTTLDIDDTVMAELKREATRQGRTMSDLVETGVAFAASLDIPQWRHTRRYCRS